MTGKENNLKILISLESRELLQWNRKHFSYFGKGLYFDQVKLLNLEVSYITFIKSLERKAQMHQNTVKTHDRINSLTRKSNTNYGPYKSFEIKNISKGENSENSSPH